MVGKTMGKFQDLNILIVDPAGHSKSLLRSILNSLGIQRIIALATTDEALATLRVETFDVLLCDERAGPTQPDKFVRKLRSDVSITNVTMPVVLISAGTNHGRVATWRDAGGSDVIVKPISLDALKLRLQALILNPRNFVTARSFIGPDRRRAGADRRQFGERRPPGGDRRNQQADGAVFSMPRLDTLDDMPDK
jgi:DNA-binding response OmpR family regulator